MNAPLDEEAIFTEALTLSPEERAAYLDQATRGHDEAKRRIETLLSNYEAGSFLEKAAAQELSETLCAEAKITEKTGDTIGRYKLLQQIGEGGCGVVYMAEQSEPVRRRVALKIIKLGMDTKSVIARFEAERQALAMMDHPNIAKVFDAGATETGRPYFVMELVRGMKITEYCDEAKLTTHSRLDLFIQVCHAIQHAHQKGIIHRDIKPSNILVTVNDGVPVPKVIDFGIAKATSGQVLTDKTLFTAFEQFIGTPAYMSPEQAVLTSLDIDTRSDVYALGVLLYELLTGKTPFDPRELMTIGLDEMRRTIREQEPARPSTRVSGLPGKELSTTAQRRGLEAPKLVSELRGDLDCIVMKALEKDRNRRYESATGLASDIQRHLKHEPIVARPATSFQRLAKWTRRRPAIAAVASIIILASIACAILAVYASKQAFRATANAREAAVARGKAESAAEQEVTARKRAETALADTKRASYLANIYAADAYFRANEFGEVKRRLDACDPDLRNWEWRCLKLLSDTSVLTIPAGATVSVSPDGKWLGMVENANFKLFEAQTGKLLLVTNSGTFTKNIVFSADSKFVALGGSYFDAPEKIRVWRVDPFEQVAVFLFPPPTGVESFSFDHSGRFLIASMLPQIRTTVVDGASSSVGYHLGGESTLYLCSLFSSNRVEKLGELGNLGARFVSASRDDKLIATTAQAIRATKFWEFPTDDPKLVAASPKEVNHSAYRCLYSYDPHSGRTFKLLIRGRNAQVVDVFESSIVHELTEIDPEIDQWAISTAANRLVTASRNVLKIWDLATSRNLGVLSGHVLAINYLWLSADGARIITADRNEVKVWDTKPPAPITLKGPGLSSNRIAWSVNSIAYTQDPEVLAAANSGGSIQFWNVKTGAFLGETPRSDGNRETQLRLPKRGDLMATSGTNITLWDGRSRTIIGRLEAMPRGDLSMKPDGTTLIYALENRIAVWDVATRSLRTNIHCDFVQRAQFSPDGSLIACSKVGWDALKFLDGMTFQERFELKAKAYQFAFHPNSKRLVCESQRELFLWDLQSQTLTAQARTDANVRCLAFAPDGSRLFTGSDDGGIRVWDASTLELFVTLRDVKSSILSIAVSPDGTQLAASSDRVITLWNTIR